MTHPTSHRSRFSQVFLGCALLMSGGQLMAADPVLTQTNGVAATTNGIATTTAATPVERTDYRNLARWVADRNIFDPNRQPRTPGAPIRPTNTRPTAPADAPTFAFVGMMEAAKGPMAFFDGNSSDYKKALQLKGMIANHTVEAIGPNWVKLSTTNQKVIVLKLGNRMRLDSEAGWQESTAEYTSASGSGRNSGSEKKSDNTKSNGSTGDAPSDAGADEVLKRLMKKRELEMK